MPRYKFNDLVYNITEKATPKAGDEKMYIGLEHMDSNNLSITRWGSDVPLKGQKLCMRKGDILFGKRNTYLRRVAVAPHDGLFSAHGMIFRPKTEIIIPEYLLFFIASDVFMDAAIRISVGSLSPTVNWKTLKELEFEIPKIEEQEKKAATLSAMNRTKEAYQNLIIRTDELVKSQFIEMFDAGTACRCEAVVSDYADVLGGYAFKSKLFSQNKIPVIRIGNIIDETIQLDKSVCYSEDFWEENENFRAQKFDILMAMSGATTGKTGMFNSEEKALVNQRVACIRAKHDVACPEFVFALLHLDWMYDLIQEIATGSAQPNISGRQIGNLPAPLCTLEKQKLFAKTIQQADKSKFELQQAIIAVSELMKSYMQ